MWTNFILFETSLVLKELRVTAVKSEKLKVFIVKYHDISKIYSVNWTE